jgi:hypothetical protein
MSKIVRFDRDLICFKSAIEFNVEQLALLGSNDYKFLVQNSTKVASQNQLSRGERFRKIKMLFKLAHFHCVQSRTIRTIGILNYEGVVVSLKNRQRSVGMIFIIHVLQFQHALIHEMIRNPSAHFMVRE